MWKMRFTGSDLVAMVSLYDTARYLRASAPSEAQLWSGVSL